MEPAMLLGPSTLIPLAALVVVLLGVAVGIFKVVTNRRSAKALQLWTHAAYSLWTGGEDSATWLPDRAQKALASWYGAAGAAKFWELIAGLRAGRTGNVAWDRVRAFDLLRMGRAAQLIDDDQCWTEASKIATELQSTFRSWEELAQAFEAGMHDWQRGRNVTSPAETGRVQRNLPVLRQQVWPGISFRARLATSD